MGAGMSCATTFHDRIGRERLEGAVAPVTVDEALALIDAAVAETARLTLGSGPCEVEVSLVADAEMTRLNFDHMGERGPTDVLSFPLHAWHVGDDGSQLADDDISPPGALLLGDVVLDVDQAVRQAAEGGWGILEELVLLTVHGVLHLVGHDHAEIEEEQSMRTLEGRVMTALRRRHPDIDLRHSSLFDRTGHATRSGV